MDLHTCDCNNFLLTQSNQVINAGVIILLAPVTTGSASVATRFGRTRFRNSVTVIEPPPIMKLKLMATGCWLPLMTAMHKVR